MTGGPQSSGGGSRVDDCRLTTGNRIPAHQSDQNGITSVSGSLGGVHPGYRAGRPPSGGSVSQCRGAWARISLRRSSSSPSMYAVVGVRPSTSRTMLQIATNCRSSMVLMSLMRGAYARTRPASLHPISWRARRVAWSVYGPQIKRSSIPLFNATVVGRGPVMSK
jgi:hypothetical protein